MKMQFAQLPQAKNATLLIKRFLLNWTRSEAECPLAEKQK
jgi:hypothetical protein